MTWEPVNKREYSDPLTPFGRLCADGRAKLEMTKPELAKQIKTSPRDVSDIELGKKTPSGHYVLLVTRILGLDTEEVEISLERSGSEYQITRISPPKYGE